MLVAALGLVGILERRTVALGITAALYCIVIWVVAFGSPVIPPGVIHQIVFNAIGAPFEASYLTAIFMSGVCARLYREKLNFRPSFLGAAFAIFAVAVLLLPQPFPILAAGMAGVYVLLWAAISLKSRILQSINNKYDFSYGIYLYAWPVASLIIVEGQKDHLTVGPIVLTGLTALFATFIAIPSWYLIEKPMLSLRFRHRATVRE